ncbi:MAG TPA: dATP/dGTP diphosphohydrolase domain-containing protein [Phycisphaerae bacterium]|nr:dATP/dGTP diphosphohydrolase domain-containing protein [Phycisphaerae bacterium]
MNDLEIKDSGQRQEFATGAVRDLACGKPRLELISPVFLRRLAAWLAMGAEKYAARNWEKGIPMDRSMGSLLRHINQYREGLRDEDHLAAAACNIMFLLHTEEMVDRALLPDSLDDIPRYTSEPEPEAARPCVYLSGPITGEPADWAWRKEAARLLAACDLGVLDPLRDAEHGEVSGNGGLLRGEPVPADRAHRDLQDVRRAAGVLAHFPYLPGRQSVGTLMELGMAAAIGKPVVLVADGDMAAHPFVRAFARVAPTLAEGVALVAEAVA